MGDSAMWLTKNVTKAIFSALLVLLGCSGVAYAQYVANNPLRWVDPTGLDAIDIHFNYYPIDTGLGFKAPLGHGGVVSVNPTTGGTRYYEFGRYDGKVCGVVKLRPVPDLKMGSDGLPTQESLQNLYHYVSKHYGKGSGLLKNYYPNTDYQAVIDYAESFDPNKSCYNLFTNNCKTFAREAATICDEGQSCKK